MRVINAEAKVVVTIYDEGNDEHFRKKMTVEEMLDTYTDGCPTVLSTERRTGRWIEEYDGNGWNDYWSFICSECGTRFDRVDFRMAYCPNCGAKMEVEHEQT